MSHSEPSPKGAAKNLRDPSPSPGGRAQDDILRFPRLAVLVGPAGSGKSRFLLENFSEALQKTEDPFRLDSLFILPSAEHRERITDLMLRQEGSGFFGARVTTFNRLMQSLIKIGDIGLATDAQRRFLLADILAEAKDDYFSAVRTFPGFHEAVSEWLGEMKESMVSPAAFRKSVKGLTKRFPEMSSKYEALVRIYEAYEKKLETFHLRDHRDGLFLIQEVLEKRPSSVRFSRLFLDGFIDFSPLQLEFLKWLTRRTERIVLTLTAETGTGREELFRGPLETLRELEKMGFKPAALPEAENFRAKHEALAYLEKNLFRVALTRHPESRKGPEASLRDEGPQVRDSSSLPSAAPQNDRSLNRETPLKILEATGIRGEAEMIAREIRRLVRQEGLHYSDFAVILRRVGEYAGILRTVFREFRIPVEIHERRRLREVPLARTAASFFKIFLNGWKKEDLFNFLKSRAFASDYAEVCRLELKGFELGITGGPLATKHPVSLPPSSPDALASGQLTTKHPVSLPPSSPDALASGQLTTKHPVSLPPSSPDALASGRERWLSEIGGPLLEKIAGFEDRFRKAESLEAMIQIAEEAFRTFGLADIPVSYEEESRRDFQAFKRLGALLEEIRQAAKHRVLLPSCSPGALAPGRQVQNAQDQVFPFEEFASEFLGLIEVDLFSLHEREINCVQVYDVSLARQKEYKVVFLAGLLERYFPAEVREDPLLSDAERGLVGLRERLARQRLERYFFYLGLTRAREKVFLSYPRFDLEGHEALPSFYVEEVERLFEPPFPKLSYPVNQCLPRLEEAVEIRELEAEVLRRLFERAHPGANAPGLQSVSETGGFAASRSGGKERRAVTLALYNRLLEYPDFQQLLPRILFEPEALLHSEEAKKAFLPIGGIYSPTSLEIYARCPYRFFASRVLELEEEEEGISAREVGIALHEILELYWRRRVEEKDEELGKIGPAKKFIKTELREYLRKNPLRGERAWRIEVKTAQMENWLCHLVGQEIEKGGLLGPFRPRYFELRFGYGDRGDDALVLFDPFRDDIRLRGKIDRVDVDPSGKFAVVVDYKTGSDFKRKNLESGTALQLPLYLLAVQKLLKLKPASGQIYKIRDATSSGFYSRESLEEVGIAVRSQSLLEEKEFNAVLERAVRFAHLFADGMRQARMEVRPRDCDKNCPFPALCRIEKWRLPFITQEIQEEDRKNGIV